MVKLSCNVLSLFALVSAMPTTAAAAPLPPPARLDLARAHSLARAHNPTLKTLAERVVQADLLINRAWSIVLPNLSASAAITRNSDEVKLSLPTRTGVAQSLTIQESWNKRLGLTASVPIFNARSIPLIKNAYDNHHAAKMESDHRRADLLLVVSSMYYQVATARKLVRTAGDNLATARRFEQEATALQKVGSSTKTDTLRARLRVLSAQKRLADAQDSVKLARTALATIIGLKSERFTLAAPPAAIIPEGDLATLTRAALRDRMDLKALRLSHRMAGRDRLATLLQWAPALDVTYNWRYDSTAGFSGEHDAWQLTFGARWSLLEGGKRMVDVSRSKSRIRVAENDIRSKELAIREEVRQGQLELHQAQRNLRLAGQQVELAEQTYQMVSKQYRAGVVSSLEVVSAGTELETRRVSQIVQQLQQDLARLKLRRSMGGRG